MLYKWLVIGCVLSLVPLWVFNLVGGAIEWCCLPLLVLLQIGLIYRFRQIQPLLILSIYLCIYALYLVPHFWGGARLSEWWAYQDTHYFRQVLLQFYVFYVGLAVGALAPMNPERRRLIDRQTVQVSQGTAIGFALVVCVLLVLTYRSGTNVLTADNPYLAYIENSKAGSFVIMLTIISTTTLGILLRGSRIGRLVVAGLFLLLGYFLVTRGYRILLTTVVMGCFLLFFELKFKTRTILLGCGLAVVLFLLLNIAKGGAELEWDTLFNTGSNEVILSHHADNLYGTAAMNGLVENGSIDLINRFWMGLAWVSHALVPPSLTPQIVRVPQFVGLFTAIGGGGLAPVICWLYWGYIGCFLFPLLMVRWIAKAYQGSGGGFQRLAIFIVLTTGCNWLSYDFHVVLRLPVLACLFCWLANRVDLGWLLIDRKQLIKRNKYLLHNTF